MRVATIILNRNLPDITDNLAKHIHQYDGTITDIFVVEAGSDPGKLSEHCSWYVNDKEVMLSGLRYSRGMNYGLKQLWDSGDWNNYDAFFLITNDTELSNSPTISTLIEELNKHPKVGILSPCSSNWGELLLLNNQPTKYFWFIHNSAYLLRRSFIESIINTDTDSYNDFLFDGNNFRGFLVESEIIAKAYANDWAAAITRNVLAEENESHLITKSDLIKTDSLERNLELYVEEGLQWIKRKYGFNSRWVMQRYVKSFYDDFFRFNPEYTKYKI